MSPRLVLISGPSGSGKTTLARDIERFAGAAVLAADDYYYPTDPAKLSTTDFEHPDAIDHARLGMDAAQLLEGQAVKAPIYGFNECKAVGERLIQASPLVIVEGQFVGLYASLRCLGPFAILLDEAKEVCMDRRVHRDTRELGRCALHTAYRFERQTWPAFSSYLPQLRHSAHLRLQGQTAEGSLRRVADHLSFGSVVPNAPVPFVKRNA